MRNIGKILAASGAAAAMWAGPMSTPANADLITIGLQESDVNGGLISVVATGISVTTGVDWSIVTYGAFSSSGTSQDTVTDGLPEILTSNSIDTALNVTGTHTITVYVTSQFLTQPTGVSSWASSFTTNKLGLGWSVTLATYFDQSNGLYNATDDNVNLPTAILLQTATMTQIAVSAPPANVENVSAPFSITEVYTITGFWNGDTSIVHNSNSTIDLSAVTNVPEPPTVLMLGMGLLGLGFLARRMNKRA